MLTTEDVKKLIEDGIDQAQVDVIDLTGTSDHFGIKVISPEFANKSLIQQHQMVHKSLGEHLTTTIHAVDIKTFTPDQA